jgi:taurine dioxygenase
MMAAFDDLSPTMQGWLEGCEALHWYPTSFKPNFAFHLYGADAEERFDAHYVPWRHPMVVRHPISGRQALFVNPVYTVEIVGLTEHESHDLLTSLYRHCFSPKYLYRHHWTPDDLVIWDELTMTHRAPTDYMPHRRRMIRFTGGVLVPEAAGVVQAERQQQLGRLVQLPNAVAAD